MTSILAFETTRRSASWCWADRQGERGYGRDEGTAAARLVPDLHAAMETYGVPDALAVAHGPGSFTGLRIGVVAARTLGWLERLPVHAVNSLQAIAAAHGPGTWLVLQALKRDTTFAALYRVGRDPGDAAVCDVLMAPFWALDAEPPVWPDAVADDLAQATIIGPALDDKPDLPARWGIDRPQGSAAACDARGVLAAAAWTPSVTWSGVDAAYGIASAPELQRMGQARELP